MMAGVTSSIWTGWLTRGASAPLTKWSPTSQSTIEQPCWRVRQPDKPLPFPMPLLLPSLPSTCFPPCGAERCASDACLRRYELTAVAFRTLKLLSLIHFESFWCFLNQLIRIFHVASLHHHNFRANSGVMTSIHVQTHAPSQSLYFSHVKNHSHNIHTVGIVETFSFLCSHVPDL